MAAGPACCTVALLLLAWNEHVGVRHNKLVDLGKLALVEADCNKRVAQCTDCLVHLRGCPVVSGLPLQRFAPGAQPPAPAPPTPDLPAGLWATADSALRLSTTVEYWAWKETSSSGSKYSYDEQWTSTPQTAFENPCATQDCEGSARYAPRSQPGNAQYEIKNMLAENVNINTRYRISDDLPALYATTATLGSAWPLTPTLIDILLAHGGKNRCARCRLSLYLGLALCQLTSQTHVSMSRAIQTPSCNPLPSAPHECSNNTHLRGCYSNVNGPYDTFCCLEPQTESSKGCGTGSSSWFGWSNPNSAYLGDRRVSFSAGVASSASAIGKQNADGSLGVWVRSDCLDMLSIIIALIHALPARTELS